jgi:predicted Zn-dependent peptidase
MSSSSLPSRSACSTIPRRSVFRDLDPMLGRTQALAGAELVHGRAELLAELPGRLADVTADQVQAAAETLRPDRRAVLEIAPGGAQ